MSSNARFLGRTVVVASLLVSVLISRPVNAGGGYFILGYGPMAGQSAGTSTAIGFDSFAGASNPAKLSMTNDRLDLDVILFNPYRRISRSGAEDADYDFTATSKNSLFVLPEAGYSHRLNDRLSLGISLYGNGGLNTEYHGDTGVPGSNRNPDACGEQPGNFFGGCGRLGFDLSQVILAPTLAWTISDRYSFGITPLLAFQQFKAYGLQAFQAISASPTHVTNQGYARSFGAGARVGLFGRVTPWLDVGAAYSTKVFFQDFDEYRGLIADYGSFDIPANFSVGFGLRPGGGVTIGGDVQRIFFNNIPALANGVSNSVSDPPNDPFGSRNGTGFHWDNVTTYRLAFAWTATERLTLRFGGAFGHHPTNGNDANSTSLNLFAPNAKWQGTVGGSWALSASSEVHAAYGRYMVSDIDGDSATAALGIGGKESIDPHVNTLLIGYSHHIRK
ncbi:long-chain fatty acid transport protein [Panacagrimonas perspica]|uniref:Long-chain fatty acid transport protein n=1 Tax=Panacagrimonas perspica TaxID=381431 RepID=A0A4S3K4X7_9GAMM|nr:outer membrane protein transport protein [Panacagrimonas perspica]TDU31634.1 long-chain fatty acid transport protein [Panacagrimonas perspica]THD03140.1 hypothetical protein B1810_11190 [Panacagrimonas perspica]